MQMKVKNKRIGENAPVFIIAEMGTNHNGRTELAFKMIREAAKAGVDAVKVQVVNPEESYIKGSTSYNIFKKVYLDFNVLKKLKREAERRGLIFFGTAGDISSLDMLLELKVPLIKISSGCMTDVILLRKIARTDLPIIISTGMSYLEEVKEAVSELAAHGAKNIALLHCVSTYPAPYAEINLKAMDILRSEFKYPIGYSDHAKGNLASFAAVALGGKIIEKHFTLNKKLKGEDHHFSVDPKELKQLVDGIRNVEKMMKGDIKKPTESEKRSRDKIRRFLVATQDLVEGSILNKESVGTKRLIKGKALPPRYCDSIIGKKIVRGIKKDEPITLDLLK